ncbi:MAG: hypothetical protein ACJ8EW_16445 [Rhizobium sp.]|uniref:hypothetical protein n=1 Tax=Rhizobium sp. TaxID=391 RepID=UPI00389A612C
MIEAASSIQTDQPYREFLTFIHNLVSTSFKWTPHAKAHSNTEGAEKFALTKDQHLPSYRWRKSFAFPGDGSSRPADHNLKVMSGRSGQPDKTVTCHGTFILQR